MILAIFLLAFGAAFCLSLYHVISGYLAYQSAEKSNEELQEEYVRPVATESPSLVPSVTQAPIPTPAPVLSPIDVDFAALLERNQDVVGWLYCEGTAVNYPVVQGRTNQQYLRHDLDGKYKVSGTLMLDSSCNSEFLGKHSIIYGHNMNDGSMFQLLKDFGAQSVFNEHQVWYLNTPTGNYQVMLFAFYVTPSDSETYKPDIADKEEFQSWLERVQEQSVVSADIQPTAENRVITFSTCSYDYTDARYVAHGILIPIE